MRRVLSALRISFGLSFAAALLNAVFGLLVAWVLVRYDFPGRKLLHADGRPALRASDGGRRDCACGPLRAQWLDRRAPRRPRHQGRVYAAGYLHCAGVRRLAVCGQNGRAFDRRDRSGNRRSIRHLGREPRPDVMASRAAAADSRDPDGLRTRIRPRGRRISDP